MALTLKNIVSMLEAKYGSLGDAQHRELETFFMENDDFGRRSIEDIWKAVNKQLIEKNYIPLSERMGTMEELFPSGDEYPDIYKGSISELDMNDLL